MGAEANSHPRALRSTQGVIHLKWSLHNSRWSVRDNGLLPNQEVWFVIALKGLQSSHLAKPHKTEDRAVSSWGVAVFSGNQHPGSSTGPFVLLTSSFGLMVAQATLTGRVAPLPSHPTKPAQAPDRRVSGLCHQIDGRSFLHNKPRICVPNLGKGWGWRG